MRLNAFGGLLLLDDDGCPIPGRPQRRRLAVLVLIAAAGERGISRDRILGLLWPELSGPRARHALSQALYALRLQLGNAINSGTDTLRLDETSLPSDVRAFERALADGRDDDAVALYAGPFLQDFYVDGASDFEIWAGSERVRLARAYASALGRLAVAAERTGDRTAAATLWLRRSEFDLLDAGAALRCMRALADAGDITGAVRHARAHAAALREHLDLEPDPAVAELSAQLRAGAAADGARTAEGTAAPAVRSVPVGNPGGSGAAALDVVERRKLPWLRALRRVGAAGAAALALGVLAFSIISPSAQSSGAAPLSVAVAGFAGPDPRLSLAVREAVRAELDTHPGVRVVAETRTVELIRLMRGSPVAALDESQAIHLAQRAGAPLSVAGSVTPLLQGGAVIVVRLLDARTGDTMVSLVERPLSDEDVLPAIGRVGAGLRARLDGLPVPATPAPLPAVTTRSLPALRNYALARQALADYDRDAAIALLRGALVRDSAFALAYYLLGDLLWYTDRQTESELHLRSAAELAADLPARERLIIQARYAQLVLDRPDQALILWKRLRAAYPAEPLAMEGLVWANLALGSFAEAAASADTALRLDPDGAAPHTRNRMYGLMGMRDTAAALAFVRTSLPARALDVEVRVGVAVLRGDPAAALSLIDSARVGAEDTRWAWTRHALLLALGRFEAAESELRGILAAGHRQAPPRALLLHARAELAGDVPIGAAAERIRQAASWLEHADLSAPAIARLAERTAEAAARAGDREVLRRMRALLAKRDRGRGLRSYRLAILSVDAATAFANGDHARAAELAERARRETFFGRSLATIALLEADARAAAGQAPAATALYRAIAGDAISDGDPETAIVISTLGRRRLQGGAARPLVAPADGEPVAAAR